MNPDMVVSIGLVLLVQLLYTLAISTAVGLMIWYAGRREGSRLARRSEEV